LTRVRRACGQDDVKTKLTSIPGIGKTFEKDFARIGYTSVEQLAGADPDVIFAMLKLANDAEDHKTSKNYLYVTRMVIYFANGGRDAAKLKWSAWKD
jgi:nucleotidyltransferase/DNA polymerase involved in DNA repair